MTNLQYEYGNGGIKMDKNSEKDEIKRKIIELVEKINNQGTLEYIYNVLKSYLKSRGI